MPVPTSSSSEITSTLLFHAKILFQSSPNNIARIGDDSLVHVEEKKEAVEDIRK